MSVLIAASSNSESLSIVSRPVPTPDPGEILIAVRAAAITSGELDWPETWPAVPGHDVAGIVAATASDADDLAIGDP